ncbi:MAG: GAF domain-containing protein [Chloroflexi bacterium]|nr:GAF domain-containing protein [Chloroflexota bacterium]
MASDHDELTAAFHLLREAARRSAVARQLQGDVEQALLRSIVEATATLFDAEAASIAIFEREPDRLEFRVAAGAQGAGAVGLSVPPSQGIVGYVFSTGQALALSDVLADPRFDRRTAERTGYVPRSIAAVPLIDGQHPVGVLQVLDKRGSATFSLRDMELLGAFAAQAAAAINATRVQRDTSRLLREVFRELGDVELDEAAVESLVSAATADLDRDEEAPFWRLVDQVSQLNGMTDRELTLVSDILEVVGRHATRPGRRG